MRSSFVNIWVPITVSVLFSSPLVLAESLGNYTAHEIDNQRLIIHAGTPAVVIVPYSHRIIQVSLYPWGTIEPESSFVVVLEPEIVSWNLTEDDSLLIMELEDWNVYISKFPVRISLFRNGEELLSDEDGLFWDDEGRGVRFTIEEGENFYGAGERAVNINHRGMRLDSYNAPWFGYDYGAQNLNITIPFVISSKLYGIYFENTYPGYFDFGYNNSNILEYGISDGQFSYFVINGADFAEILEHYVDLTGHQPLPPRWTLGFLQSRFGYETQTQAQEVVHTFRERNIPLDAIILDLYWFGWGQMGDMDWDYTAWPDPQGMIAEFDSLGVKTILITEPYILETSENFPQAYGNVYLTPNSISAPVIIEDFWAGSAGLLDITNPEVVDWWWGFYENLTDQGVAGWWCDLGEPEAHPLEMVHYLGPATKIHNIYSLLWAEMLHEKTKEIYPNRRLFNLIRSGYAGMQRYSTFPWSGDVFRSFSGLRAQPSIMLGMGLSGVGFMSSDIGGFVGGGADTELYIRWIQYGTFNPIMRPHGWEVPTEPIYFDEFTESVVTNYIRLRYQLLPYNYTLAWLNSKTGIPLARPLVMFSPDYPVVSDIDDEYYWGPSFLVAPVMERDASSRTVYLPEGAWIDYWSEEAHPGDSWITVDTPIEKIPLFVKAGSFIPTIPPIETTRDYDTDTLIVHYYPDANGATTTFTMYEDDGKTPDAYQLGEFELITFSGLNSSTDLIQLSLERYSGGYFDEPAYREMIFSIHKIVNPPQEVLFNNLPLITTSSVEEFYSNDSSSYWDGDGQRLWIHYTWEGSADFLTIIGDELLSVMPIAATLPSSLHLHFPYPNPFNSSTTIRYSVAETGAYSISIFDVLGREIKTLKRDFHNTGDYWVSWDGADQTGKKVSSGIYLVSLKGGSGFQIRKVVLIK